jgi:hypothetical protein
VRLPNAHSCARQEERTTNDNDATTEAAVGCCALALGCFCSQVYAARDPSENSEFFFVFLPFSGLQCLTPSVLFDAC